jgi:hypothetical protein
MEETMATACQDFEEYFEYLAEGRLDAYLDSVCRDDKCSVPGIEMSTDPNLLLHELGTRADMEKIGNLFSSCTVYLVSIPCLWRYLTWFFTGICTTPPVQARLAFLWTVFATNGGSILHLGVTIRAKTLLVPLISIPRLKEFYWV